MDREAWQATVHGIAESDTTEQTHTGTRLQQSAPTHQHHNPHLIQSSSESCKENRAQGNYIDCQRNCCHTATKRWLLFDQPTFVNLVCESCLTSLRFSQTVSMGQYLRKPKEWAQNSQVRPQQYVNQELPDVQAGFRKCRGNRDQIANIYWIIEKARALEKHLLLFYWLRQSLWLCRSQQTVENS